MRTAWILGALAVGALALLRRGPAPDVPGRRKSPRTRLLELGAMLLQRRRPLQGFDVHLVGFHPIADDPHHQMTAHHFCKQVNEDFVQCVIFDGDGPDARLTGVEFIISERLYRTLPEDERRYWHPHDFEILSGQLVAPRLPRFAEKLLMGDKIGSYGKTWHVWMTGEVPGEGDRLPVGPACLAWSFNRDGEIHQDLLDRYPWDVEARRRQRRDLAERARPQEGVDRLRDAFDAGEPPPGVQEAREGPRRRRRERARGARRHGRR